MDDEQRLREVGWMAAAQGRKPDLKRVEVGVRGGAISLLVLSWPDRGGDRATAAKAWFASRTSCFRI